MYYTYIHFCHILVQSNLFPCTFPGFPWSNQNPELYYHLETLIKFLNKDHFLHWDGMGGSIYIQQSKVITEGIINYTSSVPILIVLPSCAISKLSLGIALQCSIPPRTKCVVSGSSTPSTDSVITSSNPETTAGISFTKTCYIFSFFGLRTQKSSISFFTCELMFI